MLGCEGLSDHKSQINRQAGWELDVKSICKCEFLISLPTPLSLTLATSNMKFLRPYADSCSKAVSSS